MSGKPRLENLKVIVTGGSRGIGAGIAREVALQGGTVALTYASNPETAQTVISNLHGTGHFAVKMDIADESSVSQAMAELIERLGGIDGLVNNAGVTNDQLLLRMKTADFDQVIHTNLRGTFLCTRTVMKSMLKARKGSIVNITSVIGHSGNAGQSNYAASKAGIEGFTKSIAQEIGSRGIRVNCVAPGFIQTDMTDRLSDDQKTQILQKVPLQKLGRTEDVANAACFLLSREAEYITGQTLHVNGGMYM